MAKGPQDTNKFIVNTQYFMGGQTVDPKMGIANSFYYSNNLDFRTFPSQMSVLPASRAISNTLSDLPLAMDQDLDGVRYAVGNLGYVYRINTSNAVSEIGTLTENGSAGLMYSQTTDSLYIPGQSAISLYGQCTSSIAPSLMLNQFAESASSAFGCVALYNPVTGYWDGNVGYRNNIISDALDNNAGITTANYKALVTNSLTNTYNLPSSIVENNINFCYFAPDIEPFHSVAVFVDTIGSGDWTLTMHNSLNQDLGSVTITNANMVAKSFNLFKFSSQVRALVNASNVGYAPTYHFHLTSSISNDGASVFTVNGGDLSGVNMVLFAYRMVETNNTWHPMAYFTGTGTALLCIGNGEYLSTYNFGNDANPSNTQYQRHNLVFQPGDEVCGLSTNYGYLVIATERRSVESTVNTQRGRLYFWSGKTDAPDFFIDIPMGAPYGLYSFNNVTYMEIAGSLYAWSGGQTVIKVRKLAYQNTDYMDAIDQTRAYPNSSTSRYNILMMGYPCSTTDPNLDFGIWSWGSTELTYPNSYGLSYLQSCGVLNYTTANNRQLGCCVNFVDAMYSSWAYIDSNSVQHYGLDVIDNFSTPATTFTWQSLIFDGGAVYKQKQSHKYKVYFEPLPTGITITPWYIINRGAKVYGNPVTAGATATFMGTANTRFYEIQWGFDGVCVNATTPAVILGVSMEIDPLSEEVDIQYGYE